MSKIAKFAVVGTFLCVAAGVIVCGVKYEEWVTKPRMRVLLSGKFKDPSSLQFRNELITPAGWLCGEVNAKNGYGAYDGFTRFTTDGNDQVYIDRAEFANTKSTDDLVRILEQQNSILGKLIAQRKANPDSKVAWPTDSDVAAAAWMNVFEGQWTRVCL
jgi:hypothetical protein